MKIILFLAAAAAVAAVDLSTLSDGSVAASSPAPPPPADDGLWGGLTDDGSDDDDEPPSSVAETLTSDGGSPAPARKLGKTTAKVLANPEVDPSSLSDKKGSFALYGRYCGPGWTDKADRPGLDAVDEACHQHDACYGDAWSRTAPKSKERTKAECGCDRTIVKTLQALKKDSAAFAAIPADGRRVADDIVKAMPVKCSAELVTGIFLPHKKAPPPADDGGDGGGASVLG